MENHYVVKRKLQEQSGSYFVILPKIWIESQGLKEGDLVKVSFGETLTITPTQAKEDPSPVK